MSYTALGSGFEVLKALQPFSQIKLAARSNQTGAFVETQTYHLPLFRISLAGFDDGTGAGNPSPPEGSGGVSRARFQRRM